MRRFALALALSLPSHAAAQDATPDAPAPEADGPGCGDAVEVDRFRLLRQLTLDLWGRIPTEAELRALSAVESDDVPESTLDALLDGAEFETFLSRHHADLLFPNVEGLEFVSPAALVLPAQYAGAQGDPTRLFNLFVAFYQRRELYAPCKDEPAEFDADGAPIFEEMPDGTRREGYVLVEPYWAPGAPVKVCAAEADIAPRGRSGVDCATAQGMFSGECGCGPSLEHCADPYVIQTLQGSLRTQMSRMVQGPIREGRPYTDVLTDVHEEVDGPLAHYYKHLAAMSLDPLVLVPPVPAAALEGVAYTDTAWVRYERSPAIHSGVLTSLSFLLRFQTARARANRFYNAFLCEPFQAPTDGLPSPNDACSQEPDLRERCGCKYCHTRLEPAAAHWARFAEAGSMYIDPAVYPVYEPRCAACAEEPDRECDGICEKFYVTEIGHPKQRPFAGVLKAYEFRGRDEIENVEAGPRKAVEAAVADGRLAACATTQVFRRLYRREPTAEELRRDLPAWATEFQTGGFDFRALVKRLVTADGYRRMVR
ncbi:hypothetical protein L6V77_25865 [Myxococcota bacterium]|nr:hypothetical protein [Myxococcota bacterium]